MISVVIPLYNKAHTILKTIMSVLNQTFLDFEIIIVNDGSTDNGVDVIQKNITDSRLRIINQVNSGVSVARNIGVELAQSEHIAFLDGDDEWEPDYLKVMNDALTLFPKDHLYLCAGKLINKEVTFRVANKYKNRIVRINFFENPHVFLHTSAAIVSKEHFNHAGKFPEELSKNEDFALFFRMALTNKVVYVGYPLSIYNGNVPGQTTSVYNQDGTDQVIKRINLVHQGWLDFNIKNPLYIIFLKYELRHLFLICIKEKNYKKLNKFMVSLNQDILNQFSAFEKTLIQIRFLRFFSVQFIRFTKVIWRSRGYPVVGA